MTAPAALVDSGVLAGTGYGLPGPQSWAITTNGNTKAGAYVFQCMVHDWMQGTLNIGVAGASASPSAAPATPSVVPVSSAPGTLAVGGSVSGTLAGDLNGSTQNYSFAGAGKPVTLTFSYTGGNSPDKGVGFVIYDSTGRLIANVPSTLMSSSGFSFTPATGSYTIQVFNYTPGLTANYKLSAA
jgi:hypothetical protein